MLVTYQLCRSCVFRSYLAYDTDSQRSGIVTFLLGFEYFTKSCVGLLITLVVFYQFQGTGVEIILGNIQHFCSRLQRPVVIIGSYAANAFMCKALAVVVLHLQGSGFGGRARHFLSATIDCHHLQLVGTGFQTYHIGTSVRSVVAHQLVIQLRIVAEEPAFHVDMITLGPIQFPELHIGRLQPSVGFVHLNDTLDNLDNLVEADALHLVLERVAACRMVDGDIGTVVGKVNAGDALRVIVFLRAVLQGQHSLVLCRVGSCREVRALSQNALSQAHHQRR